MKRFFSSVMKVVLALSFLSLWVQPAHGQFLEEQLKRESLRDLAEAAKRDGDAQRGAIVFHQPALACSQCHSLSGVVGAGLGPNLSQAATVKQEDRLTDEQLVESILDPSRTIRQEYRGSIVATKDGETIAGLVLSKDERRIKLREASPQGAVREIDVEEIEGIKENPLSMMPAGLVNQLSGRQQFLDLVRYLIEIRDGGEKRAEELKPSASLLALKVPEYEGHLDHNGFLTSWNDDSLKRGEAIYQRVCANCHGTKDAPGSLPNSLRFAEGKFKNGSDPLSMYRTLTYGFGFMVPQTWMVPSQKYDVIHYIRERYLRPHNPSQYVEVDRNYLASLPVGDTKGPEASQIESWVAMDYGPSLIHTYEVPGGRHNFAYKGIAIRLDPGAGGVSRGSYWTIFDTDTLRLAATWSHGNQKDANFIDWRGIQFNGEHQIHPKIVGEIYYANGTGPGWANPTTQTLVDDQRVVGRDDLRYGPLPNSWGAFKGIYHHDQKVILSYRVAGTDILEMPAILKGDVETEAPWLLRHFEVAARTQELRLKVADNPVSVDGKVRWQMNSGGKLLASFNPSPTSSSEIAQTEVEGELPLRFDGKTYLEVEEGAAFDWNSKDFSIAARIRTSEGGTICALAQKGPTWIPNGQTLFIRDGQLCFDIGWVGVVGSKRRIADGKWHDVVATWQKDQRKVRLYIDGKLDAEGELGAKARLDASVLRIGFTAPNFPGPHSFFKGEIEEVRFYQRELEEGGVDWSNKDKEDKSLVGRWLTTKSIAERVESTTRKELAANVVHGEGESKDIAEPIAAGVLDAVPGMKWNEQEESLCLVIPPGEETFRFTVWVRATEEKSEPVLEVGSPDLQELTLGGPPRWSQIITTDLKVGDGAGAFASDVLTAPQSNPWLALTRFTGVDFLPDGRLAVCTWDGDVWLVDVHEDSAKIDWKRIASGLFQPLGLKVVGGKIHLTCRDQLTVLHDLNGDEEIDFYQCLNNDHQVTEHFHEFAMGLQTDAEGNFYYAKSGRHALKAVVPHHGTLLKVSRDGSRTDILATGFRAANGVCMNPDGSFVVTDQEGFWNPKNRINWVTVESQGKPKFYGNMFGYHDVTDSSDSAMEPPLCWITNAFDRSPAELLWVDSEKWGPLQGKLLNLSYGYGKVFVVPHERVDGLVQGGMVQLPIQNFPTGVMRGRFNSRDGHLYLCGMFAWAGDATEPGGLYRLRATGKPMHLPTGLQATKSGLRLEFTEPLSRSSVEASAFRIKVWSLKRTAGYGSKHYDERELKVASAEVSEDGKIVTLAIPEIEPTWCMEIGYRLQDREGGVFQGVIHNTIHRLGAP